MSDRPTNRPSVADDVAFDENVAVAVATTLAGPWGPISLAATERGLVALELLADTEPFVARLERRLRGRVEVLPSTAVASGATGEATEAASRRRAASRPAEGRLAEAVAAVGRWLAGDPGAFSSVPLDLVGVSEWDRLVLGAVATIPSGATVGYGEVARMIGRTGAARAVGSAVGRNPVGLAIPCHRVIAGDGTIGGYGGGWWGEREALLEVKRALLAREGVDVRATRRGDASLGVPERVARR